MKFYKLMNNKSTTIIIGDTQVSGHILVSWKNNADYNDISDLIENFTGQNECFQIIVGLGAIYVKYSELEELTLFLMNKCSAKYVYLTFPIEGVPVFTHKIKLDDYFKYRFAPTDLSNFDKLVFSKLLGKWYICCDDLSQVSEKFKQVLEEDGFYVFSKYSEFGKLVYFANKKTTNIVAKK